MSERPPRSTAEWVTFSVSCLVLLAVTSVIVIQMFGPNRPPEPAAKIHGEVRTVGDQYHVSVLVTNNGDATAAGVEVEAMLETKGGSASGSQTIDFLAGGDDEMLVFIFSDNPDAGELSVRVTGFSVP